MKILSLDGGGSWALIQARCLLNLYGNISGHEVLQKYDMVIANSGGSMVLACMIENLTLSQICDWFLDVKVRKSIFSKLGFFQRTPLEELASLDHIGPRYSAAKKLVGLRKYLSKTGGKTLTEIPALVGKPTLQIIICSFDYERSREVFFRSYQTSMADASYYDRIMHNNQNGRFTSVTLAEAVHGASNAPVNYFDKPALIRYQDDSFDHQFWDGAVGGYNNPVFAGVLEAVTNGVSVSGLKVLSIGTGATLLPLYSQQQPAPDVNEFMYQRGDSSLLNDIKKMSESILADPPDSSSFHAYAIVHNGLPANSTRFFRFSPLIKPFYNSTVNRWEIPQPFTEDEFKGLIDLDMDAVKQEDVELIDKFCEEWMNPTGEIDNQAIRFNSQLQPIIGYGKFIDGKTAFLAHFDD